MAELPTAELLRNKVTKTTGRATVNYTANLTILRGASIRDTGANWIEPLHTLPSNVFSSYIKCFDYTLSEKSAKKCY